MNDPISDFLTRIRNACSAQQEQVFIPFSKMKAEGLISDPKSILVTTYALCGFANFASIGIQIGGISQLAPNQRRNLTELGLKALVGGTIACLMCACIAGALG